MRAVDFRTPQEKARAAHPSTGLEPAVTEAQLVALKTSLEADLSAKRSLAEQARVAHEVARKVAEPLLARVQQEWNRYNDLGRQITQAESQLGLLPSLFNTSGLEKLERLKADQQKALATAQTEEPPVLRLRKAKEFLDTVLEQEQAVSKQLRTLKRQLSDVRRPERERKKWDRIQAKQRKEQVAKAKIAALEGRERKLADSLKKELQNSNECPYCGLPLGNQPHADHIYPIAKGGLSIKANLVLVCADCNGKKSDKTLAQFIAAYSLDRAAIERRLSQLRKDF